jgi:hypothetical protein
MVVLCRSLDGKLNCVVIQPILVIKNPPEEVTSFTKSGFHDGQVGFCNERKKAGRSLFVSARFSSNQYFLMNKVDYIWFRRVKTPLYVQYFGNKS